jgi:Cu+-exporting ATPase
MTCQGCARRVAEAVGGVAGVVGASVDLPTGRLVVQWKADARPDAAAVTVAVEQAGYRARQATVGPPQERSEAKPFLSGWGFNVVAGSAATALLMLGDWVFGWASSHWFHWFSFAVALPVQVFCGARFYQGAWNQLRSGRSNMDTLVALGSTTAFGYSAWALLANWPVHVYFTEAAAIITLISVGHWLEAMATERAASSLRALLNLAPRTARRLGPGEAEIETPVAELRPGDRVLLKPGDHVPTDGVVAEGQSVVDEAMLTGESLPVDKPPGAPMYAGTVNRSGRLVMRVTATGEGTALAQIIAVVQRAQNSRAAIQRLGDRVSNVFVPLVVLLALASGVWWGLAFEQARELNGLLAPFLWHAHIPSDPLAAAVIHAAAVLIVACPCAMGLATPVAIMAGANVAARRGILIRDAMALEKTGRLTSVLFDKTGTLTEGHARVAAVKDCSSQRSAGLTLETLAAALAAPSTHPLSEAIASQYSGLARVELVDWTELRGRGVQARLAGLPSPSDLEERWLRLGSLSWLSEQGVVLDPAGEFIRNWSAQGASVLGLAADEQLLGCLALRDALKPHAAQVVAQLVAQGRSAWLITGDNQLTATAIARMAGIPAERVFAEVRPERKAELVRKLQERGERVAFVGDGINDAPALEQADLGVAVAQASDVAREAADIILLRSDIDAIPEALSLAQATLRIIKQNLFWAFFYNAAAVPLAALGFISPILCAASMGLSDLMVIGNALRLRRWRAG